VISPKLVEVGRHLNIELLTGTELLDLQGDIGNFSATVRQKPRFVDLSKCTSCGDCAKVCPISLPDEYNQGLNERKAIFKQYAQAIPGAYGISKRSVAPCRATCPAHVSVQGYIALINEGKYKEALALFRQDHPFPAVCGRVCHHPCEEVCTRGEIEQPMAIRELHRFLADWEISQGDPVIPEVAEARPEKVAVIGAGPAGLSTAFFLAKQGYRPVVFEKLPRAGGMMAFGIPDYRLPPDILAREIGVIEAMGVTIQTGVAFGTDVTLESLEADGYQAVFLSTGLHGGRPLGVENEDAEGVLQGVTFLRDVALGNEVSIGEEVLVIGGGNVAIDVALTAKRKGAKKVTLVCLEARDEMPAWQHEIEEALESDIEIVNSFGPKAFFIDKRQRVSGLEFKTCTAVFDGDGRFNPQYDEDQCQAMFGDTVIIAIGQSAELAFAEEEHIATTPPGGLQADPVTLQTNIEWVFAGGDAVYGPKSVVDAVACGKTAAESIHRFINGMDLAEGRDQSWEFEKPDTALEAVKPRVPVRCLDPEARECNFLEVSYGYDEKEARAEAERCLSCGICSECYQCVEACLAEAVNHDQEAREDVLNVGAVVLSSGCETYDPAEIAALYQYKVNPNVMTSLEFERILSASGPTMGHLVRPTDEKEPEKIAWLQCIGSRDTNKCGNGYCSSVCCMYAIKDAMIAKEHAEGDLDCAIFNMDIRTFGKDYEQYYLRAKEREGVRFERARVHSIIPAPENDDLILRYSDDDGTMHDEVFSMVVLSVGLEIPASSEALAQRLGVALTGDRFVDSDPFAPVQTSRRGVYACGVFQGPKDIPESVTQASAAAGVAGAVLSAARGTDAKEEHIPEERDVTQEELRVGVFVCNCGINIGGVVDVPAVAEFSRSLPGVVLAEENLFTCSQDAQDKMKEVIQENQLNRVVVASCSPKTHQAIFMDTLVAVGLNKYLFEMANIRNQDSWVHANDPEAATRKAKELISMAVGRVSTLRPLSERMIAVNPRALILGGGVAGMNAALTVAEQGFPVTLVEKQALLGGMALKLHHTIEGGDIPAYVAELTEKVNATADIEVLTNASISGFSGYKGNFQTEVTVMPDEKIKQVDHGVIIVATGGNEYKPSEYLYGEDDRVITQVALGDRLQKKGVKDLSSVVMIQCVGSRNDDHPNCSRICCQNAVKNALAIKRENPETAVYILNRDIRTYGTLEHYYTKARERGVIFIRFDKDHPPQVKAGQDGIKVLVKDHVLRQNLEITTDLLTLSAGVRATDTDSLAKIMKLGRNPEGYFIEAHVKLRPVDMPSDGIFLCGTAHGPKLVSEAISQAQAAASRAVTFLAKKSLRLSAITAKLETDHCVKCLTCVRSCPFGVPQFDEQSREIVIDEALCQGCGVCTAVCPRQTIGLSNYEDDQITCKIDCLLEQAF
jgi:heterodisulfide reductase subunit A-like polyferredoxin